MTLSATSVSFEALRERALPPLQSMSLFVSDAVFRITYDALPDWLSLDGAWIGNEVVVTVRIERTDLPEGTYSFPLTFYAYSEGAILPLEQDTVVITLEVREIVEFSTPSVSAEAVYGHPTQTQTINVNVLAPGERWQVSTDASWITLPPAIQEGSATLQIGVDSSGMAPGARSAHIQLINPDDPAESDELFVLLSVQTPSLIQSPPYPFPLGGNDGLDDSPRPFNFSLNTGANAYPWSVTPRYVFPFPPQPWIQLTKTSGTVGGSGDAFVIDALRDVLLPGSHEAYLRFEFQVLGRVITQDVRVSLNFEENRIYAIGNGVSLHDLPSRDRLSAAVQVLNSRERLDIPWTAESDQPWLSVTSEGLTGGLLSLQADTAALAVDTVHVATVTIRSPDAAVDNEETVTVALWKGSDDPGDLSISAPFDHATTNPVFPYVHASKDNVLRTYNSYTGALVSTFDLPYGQSGSMAVSTDGRTIYVPDVASSLISGVDLESGQVTSTVDGGSRRPLVKAAYLRVEGHPLVRRSPYFDPDIAPSKDGRRFFTVTNYESGSFSYNGYVLDHTALFGGHTNVSSLHGVVGGDDGQVTTLALANDRERVLMSVTAPNEFRLYDGMQRQLLWAIPAPGTPNNTIVRSDDLLIVGARVGDESADIQLLGLDGGLIDTLSSPAGALLDDQMALTSDPGRLMAPTDANVIGILELP